MFVYKVGFGSFEDSYYCEFMHPKKMSKREFLDKVEQCFKSVIKEYKECILISMQTLFIDDKFKVEMRKLGFEDVKYHQDIRFEGWSLIFAEEKEDEDGWDIDDDQKRIHENLRKELNK